MVKMVDISMLMNACFKEQAALQVLDDFRRYELVERKNYARQLYLVCYDRPSCSKGLLKKFMPKRIVFPGRELDQIGTGKPKRNARGGVENLS